MSELISRQAAIDVVRKWFDKIQLNGDICLDGIISLPSVKPKGETITEFADRCRECGAKYGELLKSKTGSWIVHPKGGYAYLVCSNCLSYAPLDCKTNYCPDCGACMVESEGEK